MLNWWVNQVLFRYFFKFLVCNGNVIEKVIENICYFSNILKNIQLFVVEDRFNYNFKNVIYFMEL